jgi:hypothetical protein
MTGFPEERQGFTDMTFSLVRFEVANILRRIQYIPPGPVRCNQLFAKYVHTQLAPIPSANLNPQPLH